MNFLAMKNPQQRGKAMCGSAYSVVKKIPHRKSGVLGGDAR
jgi:hypothetical protein